MQMDSILITIKKLLGPDHEDKSFDVDIITNINSTLSTLTQLGVGPKEGFSIENDYDEWEDFLQDKMRILEFVKQYIYLKVRLVFDPPTNSAVITAMKETIKELEWRIEVAANSEE